MTTQRPPAVQDSSQGESQGEDSPAVTRLRDAVRRLAAVTAARPRTGLGHDDAPDDEGTAATDDAIGFDPVPLLETFDQYGVQVVAIGQVAGILHGSTELTGDLDLLWDGGIEGTSALAAAFRAGAVTVTDDDGRVLYEPAPGTSGASAPGDATADLATATAALAQHLLTLPKVQFRSPRASGDCCTPALPWGDLAVAEYLRRAESAVTAAGRTIRYLALDDLIRMRRAVDRPKDRRRAAELETLRPPETSETPETAQPAETAEPRRGDVTT